MLQLHLPNQKFPSKTTVLSFYGLRALSLLLLQIKFPQWFVSFERQKICIGKVCVSVDVIFICLHTWQYFAMYVPMHKFCFFINVHILSVLFAHVYMCICLYTVVH